MPSHAPDVQPEIACGSCHVTISPNDNEWKRIQKIPFAFVCDDCLAKKAAAAAATVAA